ncbi:MAG TPA: molecular chaperone DnaJ [Bacteroidales bacterium]|nr:molecular chaperone DnaJ [Bacteroidales bacterium]
MKFGKWIGGGLGWAFFGPLGALIGFAVGAGLDSTDSNKNAAGSATGAGDFAAALLVLTAAVMKADGKVVKAELDYVKEYLKQSFGEEKAAEGLLLLRNLLKQNVPVEDVCLQIRENLNYSGRLQLLHYLYGVAGADYHYDSAEIKTIDYISFYLGISAADANSIKAMFAYTNEQGGDYKYSTIKTKYNIKNAYTILEIGENVTDEEVKKAYRKMAIKYHPDKVIDLGEDVQLAAKEKFQKVAEAYEKIKEQRGMR